MKRYCCLIVGCLLLAAVHPASRAAAQDLPTVVVVATGGTIAMTLDPETGAPVPALSGEDLVTAVPALAELANIQVVEFSNIPSPHMGPDRWPDLARTVDEALADPEVAGVVVTHGTDTLEEVAFLCDLVYGGGIADLITKELNGVEATAEQLAKQGFGRIELTKPHVNGSQYTRKLGLDLRLGGKSPADSFGSVVQ
jgi:hypothetical protein